MSTRGTDFSAMQQVALGDDADQAAVRIDHRGALIPRSASSLAKSWIVISGSTVITSVVITSIARIVPSQLFTAIEIPGSLGLWRLARRFVRFDATRDRYSGWALVTVSSMRPDSSPDRASSAILSRTSRRDWHKNIALSSIGCSVGRRWQGQRDPSRAFLVRRAHRMVFSAAQMRGFSKSVAL